MQYEIKLGLRKEHSFDEVRSYIQRGPDKTQYPKRGALFLQQSHIYGQVEVAVRNYGSNAQQDQARYRESADQAPYVPPKPKPPRGTPQDPMGQTYEDPTVPDDRMDEQITGPPPAPPPGRGGGGG